MQQCKFGRHSANAPPPGGLVFGRPGWPVSLFPSPLLRGDGAPGGARRLAKPPYGPCEGPLSAPTAVSPVARGLTVNGVRAANDVGRCASRRSTAARIVGGRTLLRLPNVAIDDALDEPGTAKIRPIEGPGISFCSGARRVNAPLI